MMTFEEWKPISAVIGVVLGLLGLMMLWLRNRYGGDPQGERPQREAKRSPDWHGRPLSPAEWEALRQKGMTEAEIAQVDRAARWAGRSDADPPPA